MFYSTLHLLILLLSFLSLGLISFNTFAQEASDFQETSNYQGVSDNQETIRVKSIKPLADDLPDIRSSISRPEPVSLKEVSSELISSNDVFSEEGYSIEAILSSQGEGHLKKILTIGIPQPSQTKGYHTHQEDIAILRTFMKKYWLAWGEQYGFEIKFQLSPYQTLYSELLNGSIDILTTSTYSHNLTSWVKYSIPYLEAKTLLAKRIGESIEGGKVGFDLPTSIIPFGFNINNDVEIHTNSTSKVLDRVDKLNYIFSWSVRELNKELAIRGLSEEFSVATKTSGIPIRSMTRFEDEKLMLLINRGIREFSNNKTQMLWQQATENNELASFAPVVGTYIPELTNKQSKKIAEHPVLTYAYIVDGEEPYFIAEDFLIEGYIIDVMRSLSLKLGLTFKAKPYYSFQEAMDAVKNREVDMFPGVYRTEQRLSSLEFTTDIDRTLLAIASEDNYYTIRQLKGKRLALVRGLYENELLADLLPVNPIIYLDTAEDAMRAVAEGRADAYVGKLLNSAYLMNKHKLFTLNLHKAEDFDVEFWPRIALPKMENDWVELLNVGIFNLGDKFQQDLQVKWKEHIVFSQEAERVQALYQQVVIASGILIVFLLMCFLFYRHQLGRRKDIQGTLERALQEAELAKKEAEELTLAKSDFLARMSHEIRTPMNGVLGMAEALSFTKLNGEQEDLLQTLNGSARNLMALLNDVLDFSKMDAGKLTLESVNCELNSLMTSVIGNFKHKATAKDLSINSRMDSQIGRVYMCDSTRLMQVLNNLVSNSVKFTQEGFVELSAQLIASDFKQSDDGTSYDLIGFQVRDSGIGIAKNKQSSLFDPFVQADGDITRRFGGTGLGLSICSEIVTEMGGEIRVSSVIGHGSLFSITLPMAVGKNEEVIIQDQAISEMPSGNQLNKLRVLFAEDNEVNRKVIGGQLKRLGVSFDTAENGLIAYNKFISDASYDVVLSDCHMPEMDGFTLATKISTEFQDDKPHLIAITADALSGAAKRCLSAGFDDYISKPCPLDVLENKLLQIAGKNYVAESDFDNNENSLVAWLDANSFEADNQDDELEEDIFPTSDVQKLSTNSIDSLDNDHSLDWLTEMESDAEFKEEDDFFFSTENSLAEESLLNPVSDTSSEQDLTGETEVDAIQWREVEEQPTLDSQEVLFPLESTQEELPETGYFTDINTDGASFGGEQDSALNTEQDLSDLTEAELFEKEMEQFELAVQQSQTELGQLEAGNSDLFETNDADLFDTFGLQESITTKFNDSDFLPELLGESMNDFVSFNQPESNNLELEFSLPEFETFNVAHVLSMSGEDEEIALDILDTFVKNYQNDIQELEAAGAIQDALMIKDIAHRIKGSALYLGNDPLSTVAKDIEKNALKNDLTYSDERIEFVTKGLAILGQEIEQYCEGIRSPTQKVMS
ncbi:transporter substrate-binding domain-containing protein [Vibrio sp. 99-70-13A1]|uniref:ATP-binding protein n=1 Tax=Vibrio sp. 99-70-13A1 TaxID=2607601 RepID=UPI00149352C6|nr:transporter substrate-binding domain-containing protein [Vibrio sp. 99-70-13A1]